MATVYVLRSAEGLRYVGYTNDLERRVAEHNGPENTGWTRRGTEWRVVYTEEWSTVGEARHREKWLKTGVGREYLDSVLATRKRR